MEQIFYSWSQLCHVINQAILSYPLISEMSSEAGYMDGRVIFVILYVSTFSLLLPSGNSSGVC